MICRASFTELFLASKRLPGKETPLVYFFLGYERAARAFAYHQVLYVGSTEWMANRFSGHREKLRYMNETHDLSMCWIFAPDRSKAYRLESRIHRFMRTNGDAARDVLPFAVEIVEKGLFSVDSPSLGVSV